jgi:hypothetical protein
MPALGAVNRSEWRAATPSKQEKLGDTRDILLPGNKQVNANIATILPRERLCFTSWFVAQNYVDADIYLGNLDADLFRSIPKIDKVNICGNPWYLSRYALIMQFVGLTRYSLFSVIYFPSCSVRDWPIP